MYGKDSRRMVFVTVVSAAGDLPRPWELQAMRLACRDALHSGSETMGFESA